MREYTYTYRKINCWVIALSNKMSRGYVEIPTYHPWHTDDIKEIKDVLPSIHGEELFIKKRIIFDGQKTLEVKVLGFDCDHYIASPQLSNKIQRIAIAELSPGAQELQREFIQSCLRELVDYILGYV